MSLVTIQALTVPGEFHGDYVAPLVARLEAASDFETSEGYPITRGKGFEGFGQQFAASIDVNGIITIASGDAYATTNSTSNPNVKYKHLAVYDATGACIVKLFKGIKIPSNVSPTTWEACREYTSGAATTTVTDFDRVNNLIQAQTDAIQTTVTESLNNTYGNSLATAVASIGSTPSYLIIDADTTVNTNVVVPATLLLKFKNGAKITVTNPGTIEFLGQGVAQEDLDSGVQLFDVPQPLVWSGNVTNVRGTTTVSQNGNNLDAVSSRDAGRFVYMPNLNFLTTVASVTNATTLVLTDKPSPSDFAITAIQVDQTLGGAPYQGYFTKVAHGLTTGVKVRLTTTGTLPSGYSTGTDYYFIRQTDDTFRLSATLRDAYLNNAIALTGSGTGTHTVDATLSGSNDIIEQTLMVYNVKFSGSAYPASINTRVVDTSDMGNSSLNGVSVPYGDAKLSGRVNALSCALAEKSATIKLFPDEPFTFYAQFTPKHTYEFSAGTFLNQATSFYTIAVGSNVKVKGAGRGLTYIYQPATLNQYTVFIDAYLGSSNIGKFPSRIEHVEISDLTILGQPKPQYYLSGNGQVEAVVQFSKVRDLYVHDVGLDNTVGLGIFAGEGLYSANEQELYSEDIKLTDNYFIRMSSQAIGVISGNGVTVSRNHIRLNQPPYAFATSAIDIEPIGSVPSPKGIFGIVVEDNYIDVSDSSAAGVINGINVINGEYQGIKGVLIRGNTIIGREPLSSTALDSGAWPLDNGILLSDINSGLIDGNYFIGKLGATAISASQCGWLVIQNNYSHGHGYSGFVQLSATSNSVIQNNIFQPEADVVAAGGEPARIQENTYNVTVTTDGSTATVTRNGGDIAYWTSGMVGSVLRISGTDYVIKSVESNNSATLATVPPMVTAATATARSSLNRFKNNLTGTSGYSLLDSGSYSSKILDAYDDLRKTGTVTIDPASINATTVSSQTFTLTGAKTGDNLILNPPAAGLTAGLLVLQSFVSAADTITVVFNNTTGSPINEPSGSWNYTLLR